MVIPHPLTFISNHTLKYYGLNITQHRIFSAFFFPLIGVLAYFTEDKLVVYENDTVATVCVNVSANSPLERNITLSVQKNCKYDISK